MTGIVTAIAIAVLGLNTIVQSVVVHDLKQKLNALCNAQVHQVARVNNVQCLVNEHTDKIAKVEAKLDDKPNKYVTILTDEGYLKDLDGFWKFSLTLSRAAGADTHAYFTNDRNKAKRIVPSYVKNVTNSFGIDHYITEPVEEDHD
jgi:hypothetical protein